MQVAIDDLLADLETIRLAKAEIAKMEGVKSAAEDKIKERMGDAEEATIAGRVVVTWRQVERMIPDVDKLKTMLGGVYETFTRPSVSRPFIPRD
jgi:predicted phage-related endonuclease